MSLIWGIPYLLIKVSVGELTPATLVFLRTGIGAAILVPIAALRGELRPLTRRWLPLLGYTAAELAVPWLFLASAEQTLASSLSGLLIAAVPLVGAILGLLGFSRDRIDLRRGVGLLVGLVGVAALLGLDTGAGDLRAIGEVGIVVLGYAIGPILVAGSLSDMPVLGVVAASLGLTAVAYAPAGILQLPNAWPSPEVVASVVTLGLICTAVAFPLFFGLIAEAGPVRATVITYFNPAVAIALGVTILGEPFTLGMALGFVLIIGGSILGTARSRRPDPHDGSPGREQSAGRAGPASSA